MKPARYHIALSVCLMLFMSHSTYACELNLDLVDANYLKSKGPDDERYQAFYVGTVINGEERLFRSPRYVILNKRDCNIVHIYNLPKDQPGAYTHDLLLNKNGGNILLSSIWSQIEYNKQNEPVSRQRVNVISSYDYNTLKQIQFKKFNKSVHYPKSPSILSKDGKHIYYFVARQINYPVYKMSLPDLKLVGEFIIDKKYLSEVGLGDYESKSFTSTARNMYKYKNMWHDFKEQPLLRLWTWDSNEKARGVFYSLEGKPVSTVYRESGKVLSASPATYEEKFNLRVKPLPYYQITQDDSRQGVSLVNSTSTRGNTTTLLENVQLNKNEKIR